MLAQARRAAEQRRHEMTICFTSIAREREWLHDLAGADVRFIDGASGAARYRELMRIVQEGGHAGTVLHSHFGAFDVPAALIGLRRRDVTVVVHAHGRMTRRVRMRSRVYGSVLTRMLGAMICVSPEICAEAAAMGFAPSKLHCLPNAVDLERLGAISDGERRDARARQGIPDETAVVLHFGWDWCRKGGDVLLETAALVAGERDVVFLTVAPLDADRGVAEAIDRNPAVRRIEPEQDVRALYAVADVFFSPSRSEGMPYSLLEALACGLPVLASDLPVHLELLASLPGARAVPARPSVLSEALRELLDLPAAERDRHARLARDRIERSHSLGQWAQRVLDIYDQVPAVARSTRLGRSA